MRRVVAVLVVTALALAGCEAAPVRPAAPRRSKPPSPAAVLVSVDQPRLSADDRFILLTRVVYRLGLDGAVATLPIEPVAESPIVPDPTGRRILYSKETSDPLVRELRLYDAADRSDRVALKGTIFAYGWEASRVVALTGRVTEPVSVRAFFPMGSNLPMADLVIATGLPGAMTTVPVQQGSRLTVSLWYVGADGSSWYFSTEGGDLVAVGKKTLAGRTVAKWDIRRRGGLLRGGRSEPVTIGMPAVRGPLPPYAFARTGMPILFSRVPSGRPEEWLEVRRLSDWKLLRTIVPQGYVAYPFVLPADLTRILEAVPERSGLNPRMTSIREIGADGRASALVTVPAGFDTLVPLAYLGDTYDFVYAALPKTSGAVYYVYDRKTGTSRQFARLTKTDLVGTRYKMSGITQPGRVVGIEYGR